MNCNGLLPEILESSFRCPSGAESQPLKAKDTVSAIATVLGAASAITSGNRDKRPMHTSILTGQRWLEELLNGHSTRFYNQLGMKKHIFCRLLSELQVKSGLCNMKHVKAEEQLAIFVYLCRTGSSSRLLMERFQCS
jgi:hypothetical protein